jgi:HSP20 family protein
MAIVRWQSQESNPFAELGRLRDEVERIFSSYAADPEPFFSRVYPAVNLTEEGDNFYVRAELPGVRPEDLDISVVEGRLLLRGERKVDTEDQKGNYHRKEREAGVFRRILSLPARVDAGKVAASFKNGVLTITLPKAEEAKRRKIAVKVS